MTSDPQYTEAYVWVWLPGQVAPVVAGLLTRSENQLLFNYGRSYLARPEAIPLYEPELPLKPGVLPLLNGLAMPGCIRDAAPDAWGRRVIINHKLGSRGKQADPAELDELTYLLESGSDRPGALDFQSSATDYQAREPKAASLEELLAAADLVEKGVPLPPGLDAALLHGSSVGGARPKATIDSDDKKYIAKFSSLNDTYSVVKGEYIAMRLAGKAGINVAPVMLKKVSGKDVILIERFDRQKSGDAWQRRAIVSALTLLELDEMMARYASYENLATTIRHRFSSPKATLRELFQRMLFNVICGNTDDHARNHSAFWNGSELTLTPAYDICPQPRTGGEATQAMLIVDGERWSQIATCLKAAPHFLLSKAEAIAIARHQVTVLKAEWESVCAEAALSEVDKTFFWKRQFVNPFAFQGAPDELSAMIS